MRPKYICQQLFLVGIMVTLIFMAGKLSKTTSHLYMQQFQRTFSRHFTRIGGQQKARSMESPRRNFTILQWSPYQNLTLRTRRQNWQVNNCHVTTDRNMLNKSDAVVIHVFSMDNAGGKMPQIRKTNQR